MAAVRLSPAAFEPVFRIPPAPRAFGSFNSMDDVQLVTTTRRRPRHRKKSLPGLELAFAGGTLAVLALFALKLVDRIQPITRDKSRQHTHRTYAGSDRIVVQQGKGGLREPVVESRPAVVAHAGKANPPVSSGPKPEQDVTQITADAIKACREGRFDAADDLGRKAMRVAPRDHRGEGVRILTAYLRQYPDLADEAIDRMNGAVEVDLGRRYGTGAFVDRQGDELVFIAKGRHVRLSVREFNAIDTARFQVTRQFLENGQQPANDLILGAVHFVKHLDENGGYQAAGDASQTAARFRWQAASRSHDGLVAGHAKKLLALLDATAQQAGIASR